MANLSIGINLDNRTLSLNIPDDTTIEGLKYIAKVNSNNYIAENTENGVSTGYYHFLNEENEAETAIFYQYDGNTTSVNVESITLPDNFGTITEVDETATLFDYISRNSHEKVYVVSEDFAKTESMGKDEIKSFIRGYGVPVNSVFKFDGNTVPEGFEEVEGVSTALYYETLQDMKVSDLKPGNTAITLGYYEVNDGGAAIYYIVDDSTLTDDGGSVIDLENGFKAKLLIINNTINIRQLGARNQDKNNNKFDIAPYLEKYMTILANNQNKYKLYIPSGVWYCSPVVLANVNGFNISGDEQFILHNNRGTLIASLNDNQNTIWTIGNGENFVSNFSLKNILFTTYDYVYDNNDNIFKENSLKNINDVCLRINVAQFGDIDNLYFQHINGSALALTSCWEINYRKLYFRDVNALNTGIMRIETYITIGGVNASQFENVMFEQVLGDLILVENQARFINCVFNNINFEDFKINRTGVSYTTITDENVNQIENPTHFNLINLPNGGSQAHNIIINNIQLNNVGCWYSTFNGSNYMYDRLFTTNGNYNLFQLIINNIDIRGINKDVTLLYSHDNVDQQSSFVVNNIYNSTSHKFKFDIDNFPYIKCDKRLFLPAAFTQRLNNNITPCHELVANRTTGYRYLISDSECINDLGIAVKMFNSAPAFKFTVASNKIYLRAKIPNGDTYSIYIGGAHSQSETLTGTGAFTIYEITLGSQWKIGDSIQINGNNGDNSSMLIDYFIN